MAGALVAHLRDHTGLLSDFSHHASFGDRPGEWFLAIDVLAHLHRLNGGDCVGVVRCAAGNDVDFFADFGKHFAEIRILLRVCELTAFLDQLITVDVTQSSDRDALFGDVSGVAAALAADSDAGRREGVLRRIFSVELLGGRTGKVANASCQGSGLPQKLTTCCRLIGHQMSSIYKRWGIQSE